MIFNWLDATRAAEFGVALADQLTQQTVDLKGTGKSKDRTPSAVLQQILAASDDAVLATGLNFYKRARLANSFKWKLIENGVERATADEVTQALVLRLSVKRPAQPEASHTDGASKEISVQAPNVAQLFAQGNKCMARGAYLEAIDFFTALLALDPHHAAALNNAGSAFSRLSRFPEAEVFFRSAAEIRPDFVEALSNLGMLLRWQGNFNDSEGSLRQALKFNPRYLDARVGLGLTLVLKNRSRDAGGHFKKALKQRSREPEALFGMAQVAGLDGRFEEAEKILKQALEVNPKMPIAWAALASLRRMMPSDDSWLRSVEEIALSAIPPLESATLNFAMGKYYDDIEKYGQAFEKYRNANEKLQSLSLPYDRDVRTRSVDELLRLQTAEPVTIRPAGASASTKPVFVVGMPRSGTSLIEQIVASHPMAKGGGELDYWTAVVRERLAAKGQAPNLVEAATATRIAAGYLRALDQVSSTALRVVDRAPLNSEYLGFMHSVFPNARIIYMRRDPIDTCLSCYFQSSSLAFNFSRDLSDIAHYYQEHLRLVTHLRTVLPQGSVLDVPYEELEINRESWTRKILNFIGLEWDDRCLKFPLRKPPLVAAGVWQPAQEMPKISVNRWHHYEKSIHPLLSLRKLL